MKNQFDENPRIQFGKQLKKYRILYKLSQLKLAEAIGTDNSYIAKVEEGKLNVGIDNLHKFAHFFDVKYYELANPYFPLPSGKVIPTSIRDLLERTKKYKADRPKQPRIKLSPFLDELLKSNFLKKPRTLAEITEKLSDKVIVPQSRIAVLLGKHPRNKLIRVIPGEEWGGRVNKFVLRLDEIPPTG
ncbi:Transcriptional regulator, contains XRE-family HTH domain [bacterium A37T11]|nr:Transcriptional regulator, contains XRE-family HTH domain [bacterium A37T11]